MFGLGLHYDLHDENIRHTRLFWPSLAHPIYLSVINPRMFEPRPPLQLWHEPAFHQNLTR